MSFNNKYKGKKQRLAETAKAPKMQSGTPLQMAIREGDFETVKHLIENSSAVVQNTEEWMLDLCEPYDLMFANNYLCFATKNLLYIALSNGHLDIFNYLLKCSSKIDTLSCSEMHLAIRAGEIKNVEKILEQERGESEHSLNSRLAVYIACETGNSIILDMLLKAGFSFNTCFNDRSPLHIASTFKEPNLVEILLKAGADVNFKTKNGDTPLDFAAAAGQFKIVKFLLQAGAIPNYSPIKYALRRGSFDLNFWIVTPALFQNLLEITKILLNAINGKLDYNPAQVEFLLDCASRIDVSVQKDNLHIVRCVLNYTKKSNDQHYFDLMSLTKYSSLLNRILEEDN